MTGPLRRRAAPDHGGGEVPLPGGLANRGSVVRIGNTVRRPLRSTSRATHALLRHLQAVGFDGAPRFLGLDAQGREVLTYIPGTAVLPPYPAWALTDQALVSVAVLLRAYHDAAAGFDPTPFTWPVSPPGSFAGEVVSHNDPNLDNVVFREGRAVALIDFDLASPGSRVWDVACAGRLWAPVRPDVDIRDARRGRALHRLRLFVDAYGLGEGERRRLLAAVAENQEWFRRLIEGHAAAGHVAFLEYWESGRRARAEAFDRWLAENVGAVRTALGL